MLGEILAELRIKKGMTQAEVADHIMVNKRQVSNYENNTRRPSYDILAQFALLYGVSIDYLLSRSNRRNINVKDLSDEEISTLSWLVNDMVEKNKRIDYETENKAKTAKNRSKK